MYAVSSIQNMQFVSRKYTWGRYFWHHNGNKSSRFSLRMIWRKSVDELLCFQTRTANAIICILSIIIPRSIIKVQLINSYSLQYTTNVLYILSGFDKLI
jgi:hypothetical protein